MSLKLILPLAALLALSACGDDGPDETGSTDNNQPANTMPANPTAPSRPAGPPAQLIPGTTEGIVRKGDWTAANLCYNPAAPYCVNGVGNWDGFIADLKAGNLYLNLHTTAYPPGEIRGQVHANGEH